MRFLTIITLAMLAPTAVFAAAEAPAGSSVAQQTMVVDWARYQTACKGGAMDGDRDTGMGYCGTAEYLLYRLNVEGICLDSSVNTYFSSCKPGSVKDPLAGYEF